MAGANPQRTGWYPLDIPLNLQVAWVKPVEPYIAQKTQIVAAENKLFVSTAKGLYAFNADTGQQLWVYPTSKPLGHSPTYFNGVIYAAGMDRQVHAVSATTGQPIWTFTAEGGFTTNPLVVNGSLYAGNRDGHMYALNLSNGSLKWKQNIGIQIQHSAAFANNKIYFGAMDAHAYALNADTGAIAWKSPKLPGMGFKSWWPVIYQDKVIFTKAPIETGLRDIENQWLFNDVSNNNTGQLPGTMLPQSQWFDGHPTVNITSNPNGKTIPNYFEQYPERRHLFVLSQQTGAEITFDLDQDGTPDGAPMMFSWTHAGSLYPPLVNPNNNQLYFRTTNHASGAIPGAMIVGWQYNTPNLSNPVSLMSGQSGDWPSDEPTGISGAGQKVYWNLCCDRFIGASDLAQPNTTFPANLFSGGTRQRRYLTSPGNPPATNLPSGYHLEAVKFYWDPPLYAVYWSHGDNPGPTLYNQKMYAIRSNAIVAYAATGSNTLLPKATNPVQIPAPTPNPPSSNLLQQRLINQVQKIIDTGTLKPGYGRSGLLNPWVAATLDEQLLHYWHNPADTHLTLLRALPYLPPNLQTQVKTYLTSFQNSFPLQNTAHAGWQSGTQRDPFFYPNYEFRTFEAHHGPLTSTNFPGWNLPPHNIYAIWKAAQAGIINPATAFDSIKTKLASTVNETQITGPQIRNAYLAGYKGYIELAKLAGRPASEYSAYQTTYSAQISKRIQEWANYPVQTTSNSSANKQAMAVVTMWNFLYLMPEVASDLLTADPSGKMVASVNLYQQIAPHWMIGQNEETQSENGIMPYQQTHSMFQALAKIQKAPYGELTSYLDDPVVPIGDLYYIDNLVAALESTSVPTVTQGPSPTTAPVKFGDLNTDGKIDYLDYQIIVAQFSQPYTLFQFNALVGNFGK
jgi:hypothetical protein